VKRQKLRLIIPVFNEEENIALLAHELNQILPKLQEYQSEVIWVDDGSTDRSWERLVNLEFPHNRIRLNRNYGQSTAIMAGLDCIDSGLVITLDGDLQNDPSDIPSLLLAYEERNCIVLTYRETRKDHLIRRVPSKLANMFARKITGVGIKDFGCTLKLFRKEDVAGLRLNGEMHRLLSFYLVKNSNKFIQIPNNHRPRLFGASKYGLGRTFKFIADLLLAMTLDQVKSRPIYFFGKFSSYIFTAGIIMSASALVLYLLNVKEYFDTTLVVGGLIMMAAAVILLSIGLITDLLIRTLTQVYPGLHYVVQESLFGKP
jgi:glycosyltransferase involved in cell wall biosynthesis